MKKDSILLSIVGVLFQVAIVILAVILIREYVEKCYQFGYRIFKEPAVTTSGEGQKITINVTEGVSPKALGDLLEAKGLIRDSLLFTVQYYCSEYKDDIKPGTYDLKSTMTAEEMFAVMAGKAEEKEE